MTERQAQSSHLRVYAPSGSVTVTSCTCGRSWVRNRDTGAFVEGMFGLDPCYRHSEVPCTCPHRMECEP